MTAFLPLGQPESRAGATLPPLAEWQFALAWLVALAGALTALVVAVKMFGWVRRQHAGLPRMQEIAGYVQQGADAYLRRQFEVVGVFFLVVFVVLLGLAVGLGVQSAWVPLAFLSGGFLSALAGWCGMKTATMASSRTAEACRHSLNGGLQVAFKSGAVMGLTVVGLALLDITAWTATLHWLAGLDAGRVATTMIGFGMGASCQALFARVGGGIFTKAADVGADLVGKTELGFSEDDPRNPATIADNVGDNVGDVAGMGADLYESYSGSILAAAALGVAAVPAFPELQARLMLLPMVLAGLGIVVSAASLRLVAAKEDATQEQLLHALRRAIVVASVAVAVVAAGLVSLMLVLPTDTGDLSDVLQEAGLRHGTQLYGVLAAIVTGLAAGVGIGYFTERCTSDVYRPTQEIAAQSEKGAAPVIIAGIAEGLSSVKAPVLIIGAAILLAFGACTGFDYADPRLYGLGLYGVAIAAVGMLSTLGLTLATDAYGPIADNAGGNAEMSELPPEVRERTDSLDSLGNTTAATGKGFAIGSAALTALALLAAYMIEVRNSFDRTAASMRLDPISRVVADAETGAEVDPQPPVIYRTSPATAVVSAGTRAAPDRRTLLLFPEARRTGARVARRLRFENDGDRVNYDAQRGREAMLAAHSSARDGAALSLVFNPDELVAGGDAVYAAEATLPDLVRYFNLSLLNPRVLVGLLLGVMLACAFCARTMKAVGRAAGVMVEEVRRQAETIEGLKEGTATPDYDACIAISTTSAQREMLVPALLALLAPVAIGLGLGVAGVVGMLAGALSSGFAIAIFMANAGGAWDNAKKLIEAGEHGGKGSDAHAAAVIGDTVGDPFKDTSGPSLNILIKLMSMVSVVFAGLIVRFALFP